MSEEVKDCWISWINFTCPGLQAFVIVSDLSYWCLGLCGGGSHCKDQQYRKGDHWAMVCVVCTDDDILRCGVYGTFAMAFHEM
jgi:hypothetical protein